MGIEVQIPIRLIIDPALVGSDVGGDVRAAVSDAATRALAEMDREVIAPRKGYATAHPHMPEFDWVGQSPDLRWRAGVEADVTAALSDAVQRAPDSAAEQLANAPEVVPDNPAETFRAGARRNGRYLIPSYDGDVPAPDEPVTLQEYRSTPEWQQGHMVQLWRWGGSRSGLERQVRKFLARLPAGEISAGVVGVMYIAPNGGLDQMHVAVVSVGQVSETGVSASIVTSFVMGGSFLHYSADLEEGTETASSVREDAVSQAYIRKGRAISGAEDWRRAFVDWGMDRIGTPRIEGATPEEVRSLVREFLQERAAAMSPPIHPNGNYAIFALGGQAAGYACSVPRQSFSGTSLRVLPIYRVALRPNEDDEENEGAGGTGGQGNQGDGSGGGGNGDGTGNTGLDGNGDGTSAGDGDGGGGDGGDVGGAPPPPGTLLADPDALPGDGPGRIYPVTRGGETVELDFGPFQGEPSLQELGENGERLRSMMRRIAFRLEMPMGDYAGSFCIAAATMVAIRAGGVASFAEGTPRITRAPAEGAGNLGDVNMAPTQSPAIAMMRFIASTVVTLQQLQLAVNDIYAIPSVAALITGIRHGDQVGWSLDFYKEYTPELKSSVGYHFQRCCQIKMLELLRNSAREIDARLTNFDTYYPMVRSLVLGLLVSQAELERLRRQLQDAKADRGDLGASVGQIYRSWREARHALTTTLSGQVLNISALTSAPQADAGEIVETPQGLRVRGPDGTLWSEEDLNQSIAFRSGTLTSVDPLIHQFRDIPEVVQTFQQSPLLSRIYLRQLLQEMRDNNREITSEVKSNDLFAFRAGKIREDLPNRTIPYTDLALQGIHLVTHEAIGDAYMGDHAYAHGVQYVMDVEQGRSMFITFAETVSVIALAVVCPPAAAALGAVYAGIHYADAAEIEQLYGSLIDPEEILSRADVEFDLFMGEFELALSIIPEAGTIMRGLSTGARTVGRHTARAGVRGLGTATRSLGRRARRELMVSVGRQVKTGIARHVVREVLMERGLAMILPHVLGPVMMQVHQEISVLSGRPVPPEASGTPPVPEHITENESELIRRLEDYQQGDRDEDLPDAEEAP